MMGADGRNQVDISGSLDDTDPSWSPDGQHIAFSILSGVKDRIMVMKADGSDLKEISEGSGPSWFDPAFARKYAVDPLNKSATLWGKLKGK
jgi:Tol biopolymer transport system component